MAGSGHGGGGKAIIAGFFANLGIAVAKFLGFLFTQPAAPMTSAPPAGPLEPGLRRPG